MQYAFILGRNPKLSVAEILAVLPDSQIVKETDSFLILSVKDDFDCKAVLNQLGGTIKIGQVIGDEIKAETIAGVLKNIKAAGKLNFGISYYDCPQDKLGMEVKKILRKDKISCRLVTSKDKALSAVVITKNKCVDFLILAGQFLARTGAVQEFEDYSFFDYGRPARDLLSGSLPPKLAKIMINLAQAPKSAAILDPFCGSGTIIQEAIFLGYKNITGCDVSPKAVGDTKANLEWLKQNVKIQIPKVNLFVADVRQLAQKVTSVDAIITEPYLGPALKGSESREKIEVIIDELSELYHDSFLKFKEILKSGGRIVIVFPIFRLNKETLVLPILESIKKLGFTQLDDSNLIYGRPDQKIWRQIFVFQKNPN